MKPLAWSTGTRAAAEGKDLAAIARRLTDDDLLFWIGRFRHRRVYVQEVNALLDELDRRGPELELPLWRMLQ